MTPESSMENGRENHFHAGTHKYTVAENIIIMSLCYLGVIRVSGSHQLHKFGVHLHTVQAKVIDSIILNIV